MQRAVLYRPDCGSLTLDKIEIPQAEPGFAVIRVEYAGVCGTDLHILAGDVDFLTGSFPRVLGHEIVGTVESLADGEDPNAVARFSKGALVALQPVGQCGLCDSCKRGVYTFCDKFFTEHLGYDVNGGWAQFVKVPLQRLNPAPIGLPSDVSALAEPLSCVLNSLLKVNLGRTGHSAKILIIGSGIIGLLNLVTLHYRGYRNISLVEINNNRRDMVLELKLKGVEVFHPDNLIDFKDSFDLVVECSGNASALQQGFEVVAPTGTILVMGIGKDTFEFEPYAAFIKEVTVVSACGNCFSLPEALVQLKHMHDEGAISLEKLGVRIFDLANFQQALDTLKIFGASKVLLKP